MHPVQASVHSAGCESTAVTTSPVQLSVTYGLVGCAKSVRHAPQAIGANTRATYRPQRWEHQNLDGQRAVLANPSFGGVRQVCELKQLREAPVVLSAASRAESKFEAYHVRNATQ
jgi:hypothetical protein